MNKKCLVKDIVEKLNNNEVPDELNYNLEPKLNFDPYKLWYNDYYTSPEYVATKFLSGWQSIPGFDIVIEDMASKLISPLEEMNIRQNLSKDIFNKHLEEEMIKINLSIDNNNE